MKFLITPIFAVLIGLATLTAQAQISTRPAPMWEDYQKTALDIESDKKFVKETIELAGGDATRAASSLIQIGWQRIGEGDPNHAIRAFNQAWLIDPENPGIFWGFGVASHLREDELKNVTRWFDKTRELFKKRELADSASLEANYGRVLVERNMPQEAIPFFEKSLAIEHEYTQSHIAIIEIAKLTKNTELQQKHEALLAEKSEPKSE